jgi:hypothetical protein
MLPKVAAIATYAGPLNDYSQVSDSSTDRPGAGANPAYGDVAAMTHTAIRMWCRFIPNGTGAPTLPTTNAHDETWNNGNNAAPVPARTGVGVYTVTAPATVFDEIPATSPGATPAGFAVNLRFVLAPNVEPGASTFYEVAASISSANVITVKIFTVGTSTLVDPNDGTVIGVAAV